MASKDKFEELNLSEDEIKRLGDALKDEKFRQMFFEYAQEISDPANKKKYEEEIAQLESERGMDVSFVHPEPGYVLKTSVNGDTKIFINICKNDKIAKPTAARKQGSAGRTGVQWSIPHSFAPPRDDLDKNGQKCSVIDVVFHPDTYRMAETNERFKKLVNDTALDGIENHYGFKVDRKNIKVPKLKYKGIPTATVIRSKADDGSKTTSENGTGGILDKFPYPYSDQTSEELANQKANEIKKKEESRKKIEETRGNKTDTGNKKDCPTEPKYTITHRSEMDLQEYRNAPDSRPSTRPKELVVSVDLPLLTSAASVGLEIFEKRLVLESVKPAAYKLDLKLPFPVDDSCGSAKFDKAKHRLTVTLPVIPDEVLPLPTYSDGEAGCKQIADPETSTTSLTNGEVIPESKALIEVLSSSDGVNPKACEVGDLNTSAAVREDNKEIWPEQAAKNTSTPVVYQFPKFIERQDNETVSYVLDVKCVSFETVTKLFPSSNTFHVRFTSIGSGYFPMHYSFFLKFPVECEVVSHHCSVDVGEQNVVILILKSRECRGLWQKFWVGPDENQLEEILFPTEANLELELCQLEKEARIQEKMVQSEAQNENEAPEVKVTEMSDKSLKINLHMTKKGVKEQAEDEGYNEDLPTPEIVCGHESRNLHGILKQRSRSHSESSDDLASLGSYSRENSSNSGSHMSESPISESEELEGSLEGHLKKSVSFSEHIDHATFKPGATVCSMKTALKSKRRRNRKREEKKRRRHNSTGSEYSSSDEHPNGVEEDRVEVEHDGVAKPVIGDSQIQTAVPKQKRAGKQKNVRGQEDVKFSLDETYRTKSDNPVVCESKVDESVGKVDESVDKVDESAVVDSDDDDNPFSGNKARKPRTNCETSESSNKPNEQKITSKHLEIQACEAKGSGNEARTTNELHETNPHDDGNACDKELEHSEASVKPTAPDQTGAGDSYLPETSLSWKDSNASSSEHKTQCAFNFSNSVMFDLDID